MSDLLAGYHTGSRERAGVVGAGEKKGGSMEREDRKQGEKREGRELEVGFGLRAREIIDVEENIEY